MCEGRRPARAFLWNWFRDREQARSFAMMRKLVLALAVSFAAAETIDPSTIDFDKILRPLWNQTDSDGDGFLSLSEFTAACERLGLAASFFTSHQQSYTVAFGALDGSNDLK